MGNFRSKKWVRLENLILPEFDCNKHIDFQQALMFDGKIRYDIFFGWDFLQKIGLKMDFATDKMVWMQKTVAMKTRDKVNLVSTLATWFNHEDDNFVDDSFASIMDAKYGQVDTDTMVSNQKHLTLSQHQ